VGKQETWFVACAVHAANLAIAALTRKVVDKGLRFGIGFRARQDSISSTIRDVDSLTTDEALDWIRDQFKQRGNPQPVQYEYQRISEDKADNYLNHGWEFVQVCYRLGNY
jgi:wobble nucleotide-excising tRNase